MSDPDRKAFDFAQSITQQILTLSTGITTITLTFFDKFAKHPSGLAKAVLVSSWSVLALSILSGILALMAMAGILEKSNDPKIYSDNLKLIAGTQIVAFFAGVVLTVVAGGLAV
jgi:hypothetical protein